MKEATGELNMTLVTVLAIAAILIFVTAFVPEILGNIREQWGDTSEQCTAKQISEGTCRHR